MTTQLQTINIVIVDDHKIFLEGLSLLLNDTKSIKIIGVATSGNEVLEILNRHAVDIVITDISMPGMDGIQLTKEIRKKFPAVKILALTMHNQSTIISTMIKNGVSGYVLKDTGKEELLNAIKSLSIGGNYFSEEVKSILLEGAVLGKKLKSDNSLIRLSPREVEVLKLIASEFTQQQIADKLFISTHTVAFHKKKLFYKFDVKNTAGLIKVAMENNFL